MVAVGNEFNGRRRGVQSAEDSAAAKLTRDLASMDRENTRLRSDNYNLAQEIDDSKAEWERGRLEVEAVRDVVAAIDAMESLLAEADSFDQECADLDVVRLKMFEAWDMILSARRALAVKIGGSR